MLPNPVDALGGFVAQVVAAKVAAEERHEWHRIAVDGVTRMNHRLNWSTEAATSFFQSCGLSALIRLGITNSFVRGWVLGSGLSANRDLYTFLKGYKYISAYAILHRQMTPSPEIW